MTNEEKINELLNQKIGDFFSRERIEQFCKNQKIVGRIDKLFHGKDRFFPQIPEEYWRLRRNVITVRDFVKFIEDGKLFGIRNVGPETILEIVLILKKSGIEVDLQK
ncbi:MAG: hypothetical protein WCK48_03345 [bacterium]